MSAWLEGTVVAQKRWTGRLLSISIDAPRVPFEAGQFGKLALDIGGERVARPYSFVNPPADLPLEFYYAIVEEGPLSPKLAALKAGDKVHVASTAAGFLVLSEVPQATDLWLMATGTGVGPFLSILRTDGPWQRYARVTLVYAARHGNELAYPEVIESVARAHPQQFRALTVTSRDKAGQLTGRIPALIGDGALEAEAGCRLSAEDSQVMLCGNPDMVRDTIATLALRGMKKHRRRNPGQITVENYW